MPGVAPKAGLFTNQVLNEINPQVDHCLVNATYVNDFYGYVLRYPGLARIDDYGYQSTGYVRGNLHRTTLDTIIGAVKIYHPQEGHLYQLADRDNALPVESGADGTRPPQPTLQPVAFTAVQYSDGALLYQNFFSKLDMPANFGTGNNGAKEGKLQVHKDNVRLGDVNWTRVILADDKGTFRTVYSAYLKEVPFVVEINHDPFAEYYQSHDYISLLPFAADLEKERVGILEGILADIRFLPNMTTSLNTFDNGLINQNPLGGKPFYQVTREHAVIDFDTLGKQNPSDVRPTLSALYFNQSRDNSAVDGYYMVDEAATPTDTIIDRFVDPLCVQNGRILATKLTVTTQEPLQFNNPKVGAVNAVLYEVRATLPPPVSTAPEAGSGEATEALWYVCAFKIDHFSGVLVNRGEKLLDKSESHYQPSANSMKYSILFALKSLFDTDGINMDLWTLNDLPDGNPLAQVSEAPLLGETAATTPAAPLDTTPPSVPLQ